MNLQEVENAIEVLGELKHHLSIKNQMKVDTADTRNFQDQQSYAEQIDQETLKKSNEVDVIIHDLRRWQFEMIENCK